MKSSSTTIIEFILNGSLSGFGAAASYLYNYQKNKNDFSVKMFLVSIILGFFLGWVIIGFIPNDAFYRDGALLLTGFCFRPILDILEKKIPELFDAYIDKRVVVKQKKK
jgi:uncharacterized membrane protein YfcA